MRFDLRWSHTPPWCLTPASTRSEHIQPAHTRLCPVGWPIASVNLAHDAAMASYPTVLGAARAARVPLTLTDSRRARSPCNPNSPNRLASECDCEREYLTRRFTLPSLYAICTCGLVGGWRQRARALCLPGPGCRRGCGVGGTSMRGSEALRGGSSEYGLARTPPSAKAPPKLALAPPHVSGSRPPQLHGTNPRQIPSAAHRHTGRARSSTHPSPESDQAEHLGRHAPPRCRSCPLQTHCRGLPTQPPSAVAAGGGAERAAANPAPPPSPCHPPPRPLLVPRCSPPHQDTVHQTTCPRPLRTVATTRPPTRWATWTHSCASEGRLHAGRASPPLLTGADASAPRRATRSAQSGMWRHCCRGWRWAQCMRRPQRRPPADGQANAVAESAFRPALVTLPSARHPHLEA
eukprot:scaffold2962_cov68-Isochrysis_galbana.AAC.1